LVLLVSVSGARAQSGDAAPTQTKGIDPVLLAKAQAGDATARCLNPKIPPLLLVFPAEMIGRELRHSVYQGQPIKSTTLGR
jgi:hypothetical protein